MSNNPIDINEIMKKDGKEYVVINVEDELEDEGNYINNKNYFKFS